MPALPPSFVNPLERAHRVALGALALLLGITEGPAQIALVVTLGTTAATGRLRGYRPGWIEGAVLLWVLSGYLGLLETETPRISSAGALAPLHVLAIPVGARALRGLRLRPYVGLALAGIGLNAAYGLVQVWIYDPPLERLITSRTLPFDLRDPDAPHRLRMARGLFYNRLKLAHVGVVGAGLAVLVASHGANDRRDRVWAALVGLVVSLAVVLTFRRAAPVALVVALAALAAVRGRGRAVLGLIGAVALVAVLASQTSVGQRRLDKLPQDTQTRLQLFRLGVEIWRTQPVVGVGHGDYEGVVTPRLPEGNPDLQSTSPHNQALNALAETGVLGALGLFGALGLALLALGRQLRRRYEPLHAQAFLTLVLLATLGLAHAVLHHPNVAIIWWLALGAATRARASPKGA